MKRFLLIIGFVCIVMSVVNMVNFSGSALGNIVSLLSGSRLFFDSLLKIFNK